MTAITIGVRILGPALGFIVGSLCTSVYADLSVDPKIDTTDPRWVGAWWLGINIQLNIFYSEYTILIIARFGINLWTFDAGITSYVFFS